MLISPNNPNYIYNCCTWAPFTCKCHQMYHCHCHNRFTLSRIVSIRPTACLNFILLFFFFNLITICQDPAFCLLLLGNQDQIISTWKILIRRSRWKIHHVVPPETVVGPTFYVKVKNKKNKKIERERGREEPRGGAETESVIRRTELTKSDVSFITERGSPCSQPTLSETALLFVADCYKPARLHACATPTAIFSVLITFFFVFIFFNISLNLGFWYPNINKESHEAHE